MRGQKISHYKIIAEIGSGGMGVVYKAEDLTLGRPVAIKFLPAHLSRDEKAKKRFVREAKMASALNHPNIGVIHEIARTDDGRTYIVMAYYEGLTLKEKLAAGIVSVEQALDYAIQTASGLAEAHQQGIVHRDLTPGNLLVTGEDRVVIIDFGLARLASLSKLTQEGSILGTRSYLSPEQARGDEIDERSDIFSLGIVLFESLTGHLPFQGEYDASLLYSIVHQEPDPLAKYRSDIPETLQLVIARALHKDPAGRYQSVREMKNDLEAVRDEYFTRNPREISAHTTAAYTRRDGRSRLKMAAIALPLLAALILLFLWQQGRRAGPEPLSLAIIDFQDLTNSGDPTLSTGITSLVNVELVESDIIRVVSPAYLYELRRRLFGGPHGPIREDQGLEIARKAGARLLLTGRITNLESTPYVTWQLVDVGSGKSLGASRLENGNLARTADNIVAGVLPLLARESGLEASPPPSAGTLTSESPEAYKQYLAGVLARDEYRPGEALKDLELAVAIDTTFALAFFDLSKLYYGYLSAEQSLSVAGSLADRAWRLRARLGIKDRLRLEAWRMQLSARILEALDVYREMLTRWPDDRDILRDFADRLVSWMFYEEAISVAGEALALYPQDHILRQVYQGCLQRMGRFPEALEATQTYYRHYPQTANAHDELGRRYLGLGLPGEAEESFRRSLEIDPAFWASRQGLAACAFSRGETGRAISLYEEILRDPGIAAGLRFEILSSDTGDMLGLAWLYAFSGRYQKALEVIDSARPFTGSDPRKGTVIEIRRNILLLWTGGHQEVSRWMEEMKKSAPDHSRWLLWNGTAARPWTGVKALIAAGRLEEARAAVRELRVAEAKGFREAGLRALQCTAEIALAEGDPRGALNATEEMTGYGIFSQPLYEIEWRECRSRALQMAGRAEEAATELVKLLRVYGGYQIAHFRLGRIYEEMSRPDEAAAQYELFITGWPEAEPDLPQLQEARSRLAALPAGQG
ncbi:MAG: protein kinase [Candidatus Krumholzibacteriota bacterium]|nr:protein kinase [Candidatus Krumholzibacteriota bacterium]